MRISKLQPTENSKFWLEATKAESNWLPNPDESTMVMVRQIYSDWPDGIGDVHIDRIGHEGSLKPSLTSDEMADRLGRAAANLRDVVPLWPRFGRERYTLDTPNTLSQPWDPGAAGGVAGRLMSLGNFELKPDEALILTTWPAAGNYQGVQLSDIWTSSLEYANRQTSLTADQAHQSSDAPIVSSSHMKTRACRTGSTQRGCHGDSSCFASTVCRA